MGVQLHGGVVLLQADLTQECALDVGNFCLDLGLTFSHGLQSPTHKQLTTDTRGLAIDHTSVTSWRILYVRSG